MLATGCAWGCGEDEPAAGEARAAITSFTRAFSFSKHSVGASTFVVRAQGTVTVGAHAIRRRRERCNLSTFDIELVKTDPLASAGAQSYSITGATEIHVWTNLAAGTYHLVFDSADDDEGCQIGGAVRVLVKP